MSTTMTAFLERVLSGLRDTFTVDEVAERVEASGEVPPAYRANALLDCLKKDIRRLIKRIKTPDGFPLWHSITYTDPRTKEPLKKYVQLELFDRHAYVKVWRFWDKTEKKARWMKSRLQKYFSDRFNGESLKQLVLSFMEQEKQRVGLLVPTPVKSPDGQPIEHETVPT